MELIALKDLAKFFKEKIQFEEGAEKIDRSKLHSKLRELIEQFYSLHNPRICLGKEELELAFSDIPVWRVDTVLAKLRSLVEIETKKEVRKFCSKIEPREKKQIQSLLNKANLYTFREAIELDLYVGAHTAISAYFKMLGVGIKASEELKIEFNVENCCGELFKALTIVATLPLRYLMALDGLFWDSKQYFIPNNFIVTKENGSLIYSIHKSELDLRIQNTLADEARLGCPALNARSQTGIKVFEIVKEICVQSVEQHFKPGIIHF